jgi:hypothetical protein
MSARRPVSAENCYPARALPPLSALVESRVGWFRSLLATVPLSTTLTTSTRRQSLHPAFGYPLGSRSLPSNARLGASLARRMPQCCRRERTVVQRPCW